MAKLIVFAAVVTVISCQFSDIAASDKDDDKKSYYELMEVIDKALTEAQKTLDKAVEQFEATSGKLDEKANVKLDKTLEPLRKKLNDIANEAKAKGFDVSTWQRYADDFSKTPGNIVHKLVECVNRQVTEAEEDVSDAFNRLKEIEEDLGTVDSEVGKCSGSIWSKAKCYAKVIADIAKLVKDTRAAPEEIVADVGKVILLIVKLIPSLEACLLHKLNSA